MAAGTKEDPWELKTPPGTSGYTMYRDEQADLLNRRDDRPVPRIADRAATGRQYSG